METETRFKPENKLEKNIIDSDIFKSGIKQSKAKGPAHPEKNPGEHIHQILNFIDIQDWGNYRTNLRFLALLHDLGKQNTLYDENRNLISNNHSFYSEEIARNFISDENLLKSIKIHDKYFHFFKDDNRGKFNEGKFLKTFSDVNLDTLLRFNYADSNNREKDSVKWAEDKFYELGLTKHKIYEDNLKWTIF